MKKTLFTIICLFSTTFIFSQNIQWQNPLGGTGNEWSYCILHTSDGGSIHAGTSGSNNGDVSGNHGANDAWVVKLDRGAFPKCDYSVTLAKSLPICSEPVFLYLATCRVWKLLTRTCL